MIITEEKLTSIIENATRKALMEYQLKNKVKQMVREMFESPEMFSQFEESDSEEDDNKPQKPVRNPDGKADMNNETEEEQERRSQVEAFFDKDGKGEGVDIAPYAYKLYHVEKVEGDDTNEMKNARSKFMKCLNHELNDDGYPYSFDSAEINQLESYISAGRLSESKIYDAVGRAMRKVLG